MPHTPSPVTVSHHTLSSDDLSKYTLNSKKKRIGTSPGSLMLDVYNNLCDIIP